MKRTPETFELTEMEIRAAISDYLFKQDIAAAKGFDIDFIVTESPVNMGTSHQFGINTVISAKAKRRE